MVSTTTGSRYACPLGTNSVTVPLVAPLNLVRVAIALYHNPQEYTLRNYNTRPAYLLLSGEFHTLVLTWLYCLECVMPFAMADR